MYSKQNARPLVKREKDSSQRIEILIDYILLTTNVANVVKGKLDPWHQKMVYERTSV